MRQASSKIHNEIHQPGISTRGKGKLLLDGHISYLANPVLFVKIAKPLETSTTKTHRPSIFPLALQRALDWPSNYVSFSFNMCVSIPIRNRFLARRRRQMPTKRS